MANYDLTITKRYANPDYFAKKSKQSAQTTAVASGTIHREMAVFRAETSYTITITFKKPFIARPIGVGALRVYRMVPKRTGGYNFQNVNMYVDSEEDWLTPTGFTIKIDEEEPLAGIWVEYNFTE